MFRSRDAQMSHKNLISSCVIAALVSIVGLLGACKVSVSSHDTSGSKIECHGITYEIPFSNAENEKVSDTSDGCSYSDGRLSIEEKLGILTVEGKKFGNVKKGDIVNIDNELNVSVNGERRNPE